MATNLSVGLQKKIGLPNYGSLGASCHVEFEIERADFDSNLDGFHEEVRRAYEACREAVGEQLSREEDSFTASKRPAHQDRGPNDLPGHDPLSQRLATENQIRALWAISNRLGVHLVSLIQRRFEVESPEALTLSQASSLIDQLKRPVEPSEEVA